MGEPILEGPKVPTTLPPTASEGSAVVEAPLQVAGRTWAVTCVSMGNPHALIYSCDGAPIKVRSFRGSEGFAAFVGSEGSVQDAATPKGSHQGPHPPLSGLADAFESTKIAIIRRLSTACGQCIRTLTASERGAHRFVCIRCLAPRAYRAALLLCSHCACVFLPPDDY